MEYQRKKKTAPRWLVVVLAILLVVSFLYGILATAVTIEFSIESLELEETIERLEAEKQTVEIEKTNTELELIRKRNIDSYAYEVLGRISYGEDLTTAVQYLVYLYDLSDEELEQVGTRLDELTATQPNDVTDSSVTTPSPTENIADLLSIETVKWHKEYINADDYHCDLIVTNNSQQLVEAQFAIKYFDADGNVVGVSNVSTEALDPGATHLITDSNESPYDYAEVSVTSAEPDDRYHGGMKNVACDDYSVNGDKVIFEVTNNGNAAVSFVRAQVLFYNGDEVVDYDYGYATDDDNELKPGVTLMSELSTNKSFTSYRIFYYGRID